jgi:hypothetical protein
MKNTVRHILIGATLFSLISGIVISIAGLLLKWKTSTQFSDGFFWIGAIMLCLGFLSYYGRMNQGGIPGPKGEATVHSDITERNKLWASDLTRGNNIVAFLGISGVLLIGMSGLAILVGRLF